MPLMTLIQNVGILRVQPTNAFWADIMGELGRGMFLQITFHGAPFVGFVLDVFADGTNGQQAMQCACFSQGLS